MLKRLVIILFFCSHLENGAAQKSLSFQHLSTANGLSYIGATDMCADHRGNMWIATGNGLNVFNGKTIERYFSSEYPQLESSNIIQVLCDNNNLMWVLTLNGYVTVLDDKRQFHRITLYENNELVKINRMLKTKNETICLYTAKGNYTFKNKSIENKDSIDRTEFYYLPIQGYSELQLKGKSQVFNYNEDSYL